MKKRKVQLFLSILICLSVVSTCSAAFEEKIKFKMTVEEDKDTVLLVGETVTIFVHAWVDSAHGTAGNGLDTWQMDLSVNQEDVIGVVAGSFSADAPDPDPMWSGWVSVNNPTGSISGVAVTQLIPGASSETGVGGYSQIFSFQIEGLAEGEATYDMTGDWFAFLADDRWFEDDISADGGVYFDAGASDNVFTVVPEPCSLMIMSGLSLIALRRRRRLG